MQLTSFILALGALSFVLAALSLAALPLAALPLALALGSAVTSR